MYRPPSGRTTRSCSAVAAHAAWTSSLNWVGATVFPTLLAHPAWTDLSTPRVVDDAGRLVGILRYSTVRRQAADAAPPTRVAAAALELTALAWSTGAAVLEALADACVTAPRPTPGVTG